MYFLNKNCDKIKYLINEKSDLADGISREFGEIRIDSYISLPNEKMLAFDNIIVLIKLIRMKITTTVICC